MNKTNSFSRKRTQGAQRGEEKIGLLVRVAPLRSLRSLAAISCLLLLAACASTTLKDRNGKTRFSTQADAAHLELHTSDGDSLVMDLVNHSTPTLAGGSAFATGNDSLARGIVGGIAASSSAPFVQKLIGAGVAAVPTAKPTLPVTALAPTR